MSYDAVKRKVIELVREDSRNLEVLKTLVSLEEELEHRYGMMYKEIGFTVVDAMERGVSPATVVALARIHRVLDAVTRNDGVTAYYFRDRDAVIDALEEVAGSDYGREEISEDLIADIEGHDDKKKLILMALRSKRPVHILLVGSPGTSKTLFLLSLARLKGAVYVIGSRASKAGIARFIYEHRPRFLIIDEIDKMRWEDQAVLLSLMETGIVTVMLKTERFSIKVNTRVIGACNYEGKLDRALLDRFLVIRFREYRPEEFVRIMPKVLVKREGVDPELAKYIVERLVKYSRSARDAIKIARVARSKQDVDFMIEQMFGKSF